ncbi:head-tail connector protein [Buttiauxella sp. WJP83]|uniref:head-tail connector protein n=1 Tax=Buttiauxella sp. WJP83 TaxID=2986951 RepID=UPI0022DE7F1B|nr:head-tail connector protein [Buttiauxella sp. WJP83]WBM69135.1 head-tail connector protein [Buttiauxella sp. WJP83]
MLVDLDDIKKQLRLEVDYTEEDDYLTLIGEAAEAKTETYLKRSLYALNETIPDSDPDGMHLTKDIRLGLLFLIAHFYENRSTVSEVEMSEMPLTYTWLVGPHRFFRQ